MPYLNLDLDYFDHPKTRRLAGLAGKGAEILPVRLWCYCGKYHAEDGRLTGYSGPEIESIVGWWGEQGVLVDAMVKVGFLELRDGEYFVHQFQEHSGHLKAFKERGKAMAEERWGKHRKKPINSTSNAVRNATSIADGGGQAMLQPTNQPTIPTNQLTKSKEKPASFSKSEKQTLKPHLSETFGYAENSAAIDVAFEEWWLKAQHAENPVGYVINALKDIRAEKTAA